MHWKQSYTDLCEDISILEERVRDLGFQLGYAYKMCYDGKMPGDSWSRMPLDKALESYDSVTEKINHLNVILENKKAAKERMEKSIGRMNGLENQVAYRRSVMRQSIKEIANEMGYTEGYIKNVSHRLNVTFMLPKHLQDSGII